MQPTTPAGIHICKKTIPVCESATECMALAEFICVPSPRGRWGDAVNVHAIGKQRVSSVEGNYGYSIAHPNQPSTHHGRGSGRAHTGRYPARRAPDASPSCRNRFTRAKNAPRGSRFPRSHFANVPWSTPNRPAASFWVIPSVVRRRTSRASQAFASGSGLYPSADSGAIGPLIPVGSGPRFRWELVQHSGGKWSSFSM